MCAYVYVCMSDIYDYMSVICRNSYISKQHICRISLKDSLNYIIFFSSCYMFMYVCSRLHIFIVHPCSNANIFISVPDKPV